MVKPWWTRIFHSAKKLFKKCHTAKPTKKPIPKKINKLQMVLDDPQKDDDAQNDIKSGEAKGISWDHEVVSQLK